MPHSIPMPHIARPRSRRALALLCAAAALLPLLAADTADAKRRVFGERLLHSGMRGTDVRVLQDFLTRLGIETTVDGQFGRGTARAVRRWERQASLPVDGRVTRRDAALLRQHVATGASTRENGAPGAAPAAATPGAATPTEKATLTPDGKLAVAPESAPPQVKAIIAAGNEIADAPYKYGGGHNAEFKDDGYDCSGSMSYALHGADLLDEPLDSTGFESWGEPGKGMWVTTYGSGGHSYMIVAGLRFDTSGATDRGSRWTDDMRSSSGYVARHPSGL